MKRSQLSTAAGTIQQGTQPPISTARNEISSVAQSRKITENFLLTTKTIGSSPATILDSLAEHLLVPTEIVGNLAKTPVDQETAGADIISSKICTLHNLWVHTLQRPIILQMTIKGSQSSIRYYAEAIIDSLVWSEERIVHVAALKHCDIMLASPALRHTIVGINLGTNAVHLESTGQQSFTLQAWISEPAPRILRQNEFAYNFSQDDQLSPHLLKLCKDHLVRFFLHLPLLQCHSHLLMGTQKYFQERKM